MYIGIATNNQAEYRAILYALEKVQEKNKKDNIQWDSIIFYLDSELIVKQINKIYKVRNANIIFLYEKVMLALKRLERELEKKTNLQFIHVKREYNTVADFLANKAVKKKRKMLAYNNKKQF